MSDLTTVLVLLGTSTMVDKLAVTTLFPPQEIKEGLLQRQ